MNRPDVERRVDELAEEHSGEAFAEAIRGYAATLDEQGQEELKDVLMARAASLDRAVMDRIDARGWLRRQWDRAGGADFRLRER